MRTSLFSIVSVLLAAASCGLVNPCRESPATDGEMCLATYNVGGFSKSDFNSTDMIAAMMKEIGVTVLSMNELDSCTTRHPQFQIRAFARAMGDWNYTFAPAMDYRGGAYGIGIVSAPGLSVIGQYRLTLPKGDGSEQRALAVCEFKDFVFCSTHLDHKSATAQLAQAQQICDWTAEQFGHSGKPVILCGDFNALPDSETITLMKKYWTVISPVEYTYSAQNPRKCIDYIMVCKKAAKRVKVLESKVCRQFNSGDVVIASDHLPVYTKISIK